MGVRFVQPDHFSEDDFLNRILNKKVSETPDPTETGQTSEQRRAQPAVSDDPERRAFYQSIMQNIRNMPDVDELVHTSDRDTGQFEDVYSHSGQAGTAVKTLPDLELAEQTDEWAEPVKKDPIFIRLLKYFIPWKGDPAKEIIRKIIFLTALITLIAMLFQIVPYFVEPMINDKITSEVRNEYIPKDENAPYSSPNINPRFAALYERNNDIVGWIEIDGTNINYPVVQKLGDTGEEDYYLRRDFDGDYNRYGTIFADRQSRLSYMQESRNIVLYGHNMKDDSTMFSQLANYRNLDYYKERPTINFDTLYRDGEWKIFAVMTINAYPAQDNGNLFDYRKSTFSSDEDFNSWINECRARSCINTPVQVEPGDEILTLQTCVYEFTEARCVIMARRVRENEQSVVNVDAATVNEDAIYPQAWYDEYLKQPNPHYTVPAGQIQVTTVAETMLSETYAPSTTEPAVRPTQGSRPTSNNSGGEQTQPSAQPSSSTTNTTTTTTTTTTQPSSQASEEATDAPETEAPLQETAVE